jgi:hypothetical protein
MPTVAVSRPVKMAIPREDSRPPEYIAMRDHGPNGIGSSGAMARGSFSIWSTNTP